MCAAGERDLIEARGAYLQNQQVHVQEGWIFKRLNWENRDILWDLNGGVSKQLSNSMNPLLNGRIWSNKNNGLTYKVLVTLAWACLLSLYRILNKQKPNYISIRIAYLDCWQVFSEYATFETTVRCCNYWATLACMAEEDYEKSYSILRHKAESRYLVVIQPFGQIGRTSVSKKPWYKVIAFQIIKRIMVYFKIGGSRVLGHLNHTKLRRVHF